MAANKVCVISYSLRGITQWTRDDYHGISLSQTVNCVAGPRFANVCCAASVIDNLSAVLKSASPSIDLGYSSASRGTSTIACTVRPTLSNGVSIYATAVTNFANKHILHQYSPKTLHHTQYFTIKLTSNCQSKAVSNCEPRYKLHREAAVYIAHR